MSPTWWWFGNDESTDNLFYGEDYIIDLSCKHLVSDKMPCMDYSYKHHGSKKQFYHNTSVLKPIYLNYLSPIKAKNK